MPAVCPRCSRANPAHLKRCMYCTTELPEGSGDAGVPEDLDDLVRKALAGGGSRGALRKLQQSLGAPPQPVQKAAPRAGEVIAPSSRPSPRRPPSAPSPPPRPARRDAWDELAELVEQGRRAGDPTRVLDELAARIELMRGATSAVPAPTRMVSATPARPAPTGWLLVIDGLGDADRGPVLADALRTDPASARLHALSRSPRVVGRSKDREPLDELAERLRRARIGTSVLAKAALQSPPPPLTLLGFDGRQLTVAADPLWETGETEGAHTARVDLPELVLAVPGEVGIKRIKPPRRGGRFERDRRARELGERRVAVLDLYAGNQAFRLTVGVTDFHDFPGFDPSSGLRSWKALIDELDELAPGIEVVGKRICRPSEKDVAKALQHPEGGGGDAVEVSAWEDWDEHSRTCLLHHVGAR